MSDDASLSHENDIHHHINVRGPMAAATQLQSKLPISEDHFLGVAGNAHADARSYYLYAAMDEVSRSSIALMRLPPEVRTVPSLQPADTKATDHDHIARLVHESIHDELQLWTRKCTEVVVDLVLWSTTNEPEMYRLYILARQLEVALSSEINRARYYLGAGGDGGTFISLVRSQIATTEQLVDRSKAWFLKQANLSTTNKPNFMESFSAKFGRAMEFADDTVKYIITPSYHTAYSIPSRAVHGGIDPLPPQHISLDNLRSLLHRVGMLGLCATKLAFGLAGVSAHGEVDQIFRAMDNSIAPSLLLDRLQPKFSTHDIVVVDKTRIAIVLGMRSSNQGNTVFDVEWSSKPAPNPVSSIEGYRLQLLIASNRIPNALEKVLRECNYSDDVLADLLRRPSIELARSMAASASQLFATAHTSDAAE